VEDLPGLSRFHRCVHKYVLADEHVLMDTCVDIEIKKNQMQSLAKNFGLYAYCGAVAYVLYQFTLHKRLEWITLQSDQLQHQMHLCNQFPELDEKINTGYYKGRDVTVPQMRDILKKLEEDYGALKYYSPMHRVMALFE
jgi:hypothetical protein